MKHTKITMQDMMAIVPEQMKEETRLSFSISNRIDALMKQHGLSKKQLADALGKRPCEVTKWLSGQHNFTMKTLAMLSVFFNQPIIVTP